MEEKSKESKKCKTCRFYNVGCHPITKESHRNDETPDCYRPVKGGNKINNSGVLKKYSIKILKYVGRPLLFSMLAWAIFMFVYLMLGLASREIGILSILTWMVFMFVMLIREGVV